MNLLFVSAEYPPAPCGGIGVFYQDLARQMVRRGWRVTVVAPSCGDEGDTAGGNLTVRRWPGSLCAATVAGSVLQRLRFTRFVGEVAREAAADLIETHEWSGPLTAAPGHPFVVRLHGSHSVTRTEVRRHPSSSIHLLERRQIHSADALVAASDWISERTRKAFGITRPTSIIPNGVDTELFRPRPISRSSQELLFVGTVKPEKGVFELFRALPMVLGRCPTLNVRLVGPASSGVAERLLASLSPSFWPRVRFEGAIERDHLPAAYSAATVCVLPSLSEGFGLTMAEAMSCGVPVIGSSLAAGPELAQDGRHALLVDPRDAPALASAILRCLEDPRLRERLSEAAQAHSRRNFSWEAVAERNEQFYLRTIQGGQKWRKSA